MKKICVILIFAFAVFAFIGCGDEGTSIAWKNQHNSGVSEIAWTAGAGINQTWGGVWGVNEETDYKIITKLEGTGDCIDLGAGGGDGAPGQIIIDPSSSGIDTVTSTGFDGAIGVRIKEGVDALLIIDDTTAAK